MTQYCLIALAFHAKEWFNGASEIILHSEQDSVLCFWIVGLFFDWVVFCHFHCSSGFRWSQKKRGYDVNEDSENTIIRRMAGLIGNLFLALHQKRKYYSLSPLPFLKYYKVLFANVLISIFFKLSRFSSFFVYGTVKKW